MGVCSAQSKNSGIVLRKVRILTLPTKVKILTLRKTIPDLYRSYLAPNIYISRKTSCLLSYTPNHFLKVVCLKWKDCAPFAAIKEMVIIIKIYMFCINWILLH